MGRALGALILTIVATTSAVGQSRGDEEVASRYLDYALAAAVDGRWADAEATLERASDFSDVSSDLSYLLALARLRGGRPVGSALEALGRAREADRWGRYSENDARLLEGECLVAIRSFDQALGVVASSPASPEAELVRLAALEGLGEGSAYRRRLGDALASYPRDPRFLRRLFTSLEPQRVQDAELPLVETALSRLPALVEVDPLLAVLAYPFVRDRGERRSLIAAYRAAGNRSPRSIGPALDLGLESDADAVTELFSYPSLDLSVLRSVFSLLRSDQGRDLFARSAAAYSGVVTEDSDRDGRPESRTTYASGEIRSFLYDADQDGIPELSVDFRDGLPVEASVAAALVPEPAPGLLSSSRPAAARPVSSGERVRARVLWGPYPYVQSAELEGVRYEYAPRDFPLSPLKLSRLTSATDTRLPQVDPRSFRLTDRSLLSFASAIERPGSLADGAVERVRFVRGVAIGAVESLSGAVIARTEYDRGRPTVRYVDMDLDGRMETLQRFRFSPAEGATIDRVEIDENGDGKPDRTEPR